MMLCAMKYWILCLSVWNFLRTNGENNCRNELIHRINITAELQSDVLLPCIFNPTLLGSDPTADIAAVWSYKNITEDNLLEISLKNVVMFWNNRGGRINPFPKLSTSGNFSILLHKVNNSDLGLYQCELFNGTNCRIAYQEIVLSTVSAPHDDSVLLNKWLFLAGGGAAVLTLLVVLLCCIRHSCTKASDELIYENTRHHQKAPNKSSCGNPKHDPRKAIELKEKESRRRGNAIELKEKESRRRASPPKPGVKGKVPKNCSNDYTNSFKNSDDIYVNQPH